MMVGSISFVVGLFIMGWTATPKIHWIAPVIGAGFLGLGFFTIFQVRAIIMETHATGFSTNLVQSAP